MKIEMNDYFVKDCLKSCREFLSESADATEEGDHVTAIRKHRSATFSLLEALREMTGSRDD